MLISGGETTVTVRRRGRGGRNAEFLLALAVALGDHPAIHAIACDTDGIDGTENNAGALLSPDSLARAAALGLNARDRLADNDGDGVFDALGDLVVTGPTRTNVNDLRVILITPRPEVGPMAHARRACRTKFVTTLSPARVTSRSWWGAAARRAPRPAASCSAPCPRSALR